MFSGLESLPVFSNASFIHCYVSRGNETPTHSLLQKLLTSGRRIAVPRVLLPDRILEHFELTKFEQLKPGTFGILEPDPRQCVRVDPIELDLVIVPGIAFDRHGHRVGYGGGYYDEFLAGVKAVKIGLAYSFQMVDEIPTRADDERVDIIVTDQKIYHTS